jgi:valyl-tRNA synthetase
VQDAEGKKMSKSKGNTIDPLDLIDGIELAPLVAKSTASLLIPQDKERVEKRIRKDYPNGINAVGTDALRFTFAAMAGYSRTINFDLKRCEGYKAFCNKLWNAARFVLMNLDGAVLPSGAPTAHSPVERWILAELDRCSATVHAQIAEYRFDLAAQALYEFSWNQYCDWFVELTKPALASDDAALKVSVQHTLAYVLEATLRLLHPIIPFISEEIWHNVAPLLHIEGDSISTQPMFRGTGLNADAAAEADVLWLKEALTGLRRIRAELNVSPAKTVRLLVQGGEATDADRLQRFEPGIRFLAKLDAIERLDAGVEAPANALALVANLKLMVPLAGLVDVGAELARLGKEIARMDAEIAKCDKKLSSDTFVSGAPAAVVAQERQRLTDFSAKRAELVGQRAKLG